MATKSDLLKLLEKQLKTVSMRIPLLLHEEVQEHAKQTGKNIQEIYAEGARMYLENAKKKDGKKS